MRLQKFWLDVVKFITTVQNPMPDIQLTAIEGNHQWLDGGSMFVNVPRAIWEKGVTVDERRRIHLFCRAVLIQCVGLNILCEASIGNFFEPKLKDRFGVEESDNMLLSSLQKAGVSPEDINIVILSHLHFDHAGGLLPSYAEIQAGNTELHFPNARYVVGERAWRRAKNPHYRDRASFVPLLLEKLESSGRLVKVGEHHLPGILEDRLTFRFSDGHTPGQMHTVFRGEKHTVVFAGDLIPGTPWLHLPVTMGYDRYPEQLIDEKAKLLNEAIASDCLMFFTHDSQVAACWVQRDEKGKFGPSNSLSQIQKMPI